MKLLSNGHLHNDYPLIYQKCDQECIDQEDGFQWMKLLSNGHLHNDYPLIYQKCDQECIDQEDGYQWMKPLSNGHLHNDYPLIYQKCDQEYMIIDPHEDPNVMEYVTDSTDVVSWEDWWTPNTDWKESTWAGD